MSKRHIKSMLNQGGGLWLYPDGRLTNGRWWVKLPRKWAEEIQGDERVRSEDDVAHLPNLDEVLVELTQGQSEWVFPTLVEKHPDTHAPMLGCRFDGRTYWFIEVAIDSMRACGATTFHLYPDTDYIEGYDWGGRVVGGVKALLIVPDGGEEK